MGKKKDKKKISGAVKTAAKTEKKMEAKRKKELADLGEEDIENIVAGIEREEAKRQAVVETVCSPPTPRVCATLTPHPTNTSELILFGGEHHDGKKTYVYNNLFIYNISKNQWRIIKAPGAPPSRSGHQAVALSSNKGELWIFGGEFTSVTEMQFYHYKDLWVFNLGDKIWQKVSSSGGPSSRSGHRMIHLRKLLFVFGGFHDNGRNYKYYNDLNLFDTDTRVWKKIETVGIPPTPRSGCLFMPSQNSLYVYGGYSRTLEGKIDRGTTHGDLYRLTPVNTFPPAGEDVKQADNVVLKYRWESVKGGVHRPTPPRNSFSACSGPGNKCYVFGGVLDQEETEEDLTSEFSNKLHCLDLENGTWRPVVMKSAKSIKTAKPEADTDVTEEVKEEEPLIVCTDGIFTMSVASVEASSTTTSNVSIESKNIEGPCPRMTSMMAVQKSILYLYGGLLEKGQKQFTLSDMYSLDLHKFDEWKTILAQSSLPEWYGSDSENDSETGSDNESSEESESDSD